MGKFDGKQIIGLVGPLVLKKGPKGTTIVQARPHPGKQTEATKTSAYIFAKASVLSKAIRSDLRLLYGDFYDGGMVNRITKQNRAILEHAFHKDTKQFTFSEDSFSRLAGIDFNNLSPLSKSLWVEPQLNLIGNQLTLSLPEMKIGEQLIFPLKSHVCKITVALAFYNLEQGVHKPMVFQTLEVNKVQVEVPAHNFSFEVPDGCLCVMGIRLDYAAVDGVVRVPQNNKQFNPASLCGAVVTPGNFVLTPGKIVPGGKLPSEWVVIDKLALYRELPDTGTDAGEAGVPVIT